MAGAAPSFNKVHIVRALLILSEGKIGRQRLAEVLGVGEGSMRTILKRLLEENLIESTPRGPVVSIKGREKVKHLLEKTSIPEFMSLDVAPDKNCCLMILHKVESSDNGVREREIAVKNGADGAIVLKKIDDRIKFPCEDIDLTNYPGTQQKLGEKKITEKDTIIVSFSESKEKAVDGAIAIALELIGD